MVSKRQKVAAIDCGTNSTRLLIAEIGENGQYEILDRRQEVTRLGEGVDAAGKLSDEAIDRVLATLMSFREILDAEGIHEFRTVATSAVRDATNNGIFLSAAEGILQKEVELISGRQEAELSFLGATHSVEIGGSISCLRFGRGID